MTTLKKDNTEKYTVILFLNLLIFLNFCIYFFFLFKPCILSGKNQGYSQIFLGLHLLKNLK